jgi:hypothetical protein
MERHIAIVVDWFGPFGFEEARAIARADFADGLYMLIGKVKYQKANAKLQYIGVAKGLYARLSRQHHAVPRLTRDLNIWLGEVASMGIPGRKRKVVHTQLDLAEWAHSYFLGLPLNERKVANPPSLPVTVLNRWWQRDYETPRKKRPHRDWPDLIEFTGIDYGAKVAWLGGRLDRWEPDDF